MSECLLLLFCNPLCFKVIDDDGDENYDKSSFVVEHFFRGNFTLDSSSITSHFLDQETLLEQLEQKVIMIWPLLDIMLLKYVWEIHSYTLHDVNISNSTRWKMWETCMSIEIDSWIERYVNQNLLSNVFHMFQAKLYGNHLTCLTRLCLDLQGKKLYLRWQQCTYKGYLCSKTESCNLRKKKPEEVKDCKRLLE